MSLFTIRYMSHLRPSSVELPPVFLAPSLELGLLASQQRSSFSTGAALSARHKAYKKSRDGNPQRGVSALRRTGLKRHSGMAKEPLPQPVLDPNRRSKTQVDPNHGLWGFFNSEKQLLTKPEDDHAHGRAWTVEELRHKSWEDLHSLWYICCKDKNRLATEACERTRLQLRTGSVEASKRQMVIRRTQQCIKHTLTERWYAWEDAWKVAENDPAVNLNAEPDTNAYTPEEAYEETDEDNAPQVASAAG